MQFKLQLLFIYTCSLFRKKKMTARIPRLFLLQNKLQPIIQNKKKKYSRFLNFFNLFRYFGTEPKTIHRFRNDKSKSGSQTKIADSETKISGSESKILMSEASSCEAESNIPELCDACRSADV